MLVTEKAIPSLHQLVFVLSDDLFDTSELLRTESSRTHKRDVSEPEFRDATVTSDVNMWWLPQLVGIEEEAIRTDNLDRR
jgi:hypothetical protein